MLMIPMKEKPSRPDSEGEDQHARENSQILLERDTQRQSVPQVFEKKIFIVLDVILCLHKFYEMGLFSSRTCERRSQKLVPPCPKFKFVRR